MSTLESEVTKALTDMCPLLKWEVRDRPVATLTEEPSVAVTAIAELNGIRINIKGVLRHALIRKGGVRNAVSALIWETLQTLNKAVVEWRPKVIEGEVRKVAES